MSEAATDPYSLMCLDTDHAESQSVALSQDTTANVDGGAELLQCIPEVAGDAQGDPHYDAVALACVEGQAEFSEDPDLSSASQQCTEADPPLEEIPCCATGITLGKGSRKVRLPSDPAWGTELYVLATETEGNRLYAEVEAQVVGGRCCVKGKDGLPEVVVLTSDGEERRGADGKVKVFATRDAGLLDIVPVFQLIRYVFDLISFEGTQVGTANARLDMCEIPPDAAGSLRARAFLPMEVEGSVDLTMSALIGTAGRGGKIVPSGTLKAKVGRQEITFEKKQRDLTGKDRPKADEVGLQTLGILTTVYAIITADDSDEKAGSVDVKTGASYFELQSKFSCQIGKVALAEQEGGPGLCLDVSGLRCIWSPALKLVGHLDLIDAILRSAAPPGVAEVVQKIRARLADGEMISAQVKAYLEISGAIGLEMGLALKEAVLWSPLEEPGESKRRLVPDAKAFGEIAGKGVVGITVEAEVLWVSIDAGFEGSISSSIRYEVRSKESGALESRCSFDGVVGTVEAHFKVDVFSKRKAPADDPVNKSSKTSGGAVDAQGEGKWQIIPKVPGRWEPFNP